jgi:hypothetical protein
MMIERVGDIGKNGRILLVRPKPTVGCSTNGRRRRRRNTLLLTSSYILFLITSLTS